MHPIRSHPHLISFLFDRTGMERRSSGPAPLVLHTELNF